MKILLKGFLEDQAVGERTVEGNVFRIGHSEFADWSVQHDSVARSHLELKIRDGVVSFTNMASTGALLVNGKPLETGELKEGDEVVLGKFRLIVSFQTDSLGEAFPAAGEGQEPPPEQAPPYGEKGFPGFQQEPDPMHLKVAEGTAALPAQPARSYAPPNAPLAVDGNLALRQETVVELKPLVAKLIFSEGPRKGDEVFMEGFEITFGRSKRADIRLDEEKMSRIHAKITRVGMGYRLIDLGSRNGTFVNGIRILEHPLSSYDEIQLGNTKIRFIIHEMAAAGRRGVQEETHSLQLVGGKAISPRPPELPIPEEAAEPEAIPEPSPERGRETLLDRGRTFYHGLSRRQKLYGAAILALLFVVLMLPSEKESEEPGSKSTPTEVDVRPLPPSIPREFNDLPSEGQRAIEGHYVSALRSAERNSFEEAADHLRQIHQVLPFYKDSRKLSEEYAKKVKAKQILEAQQKAREDEKQDLALYLEEGTEYLKQGDYERAAEAFNSALALDPNSVQAAKGLKAAELKVRRIEDLPPERDPEQEKKQLVLELFQKALAAFQNKSFQQAIDTAEKIRQIEIKGDTQYLNQAKQIIDRARLLQKEEFEPFLIQAKEKFAEGDYTASRDLCEEMLKRDGSYEEAKECALKAKKQLNRLAKEAYTHGYVLESMNKIEEAKQYWNKAKGYVRKGDEYYDKVNKKLEYYQ